MTCECDKPGYCPRFQRPMRGRVWEICRGINCDIGTSAHYRALWTVSRSYSYERSITLINTQNPGDLVSMTAAIYSLHATYPGRYRVSVESSYPDVFLHNPDIIEGSFEPCYMHYPAIHQSASRGIHFMQAWCEHLGEALDVPLPLVTNRPHLYFDNEVLPGDYWIVCSGTKSDFTTKRWDSYQEVLDRIGGNWIQVGAAEDDHPPLRGVTNLVGQTSLRQLFDLVRGCKGVFCGVSLLMHVAAACEKPAVIIAGAREPVQWNAYPKQQYLHTIGLLSCGMAPCWKAKVDHICGSIPRCTKLLTPEYVANTLQLLRAGIPQE